MLSGFNLLLLYAMIVTAAPLLGRRRATFAGVGLALTYGLAAGQSPAVLRGEILVGLLALADLTGRPYSRPSLLILAAGGMTAFDPSLLTDAGFQLTMAAAGGIALLAPPLIRLAARPLGGEDAFHDLLALYRSPLEALLTSLAVSLTTAPVVLAAFGALSLYAPVANALVNPLLSSLTLLSLAAGLAGWLARFTAALPAAPLWLGLNVVERGVHLAATAPGASLQLSLPAVPFALGWYGALAACAAVASRMLRDSSSDPRRPRRARSQPSMPTIAPWRLATTLAVVALALAGFRGALAIDRSGQAHATTITWLDESGGAVLVSGGNGVRLLVAAEAAPLAFAQALQRSGGGAHVDAVVATTGGSEDGWRAVAEAVHARTVLLPGSAAAGPVGNGQGGAAAVSQIKLDGLTVIGRAEIDLGNGDQLDILDRERVAVVRVTVGAQAIILAGAGEAAPALAGWQLPPSATLIAVPERLDATTFAAMSALRPRIVVVTGSAPPGAQPDAAGDVAGIRIVRMSRVRNLRVAANGGRLRVTYRDR